ncbi:ATP--guanido phosphotransferase [Leptospira langatensis]|uniref:ATP--guanido phosphotransferase n=1 Tax=Leptospira langatensis TaxID=2484983 RepID=A0A5F1ZW04_9LEPT|nr:ATP--guanido phosphotransferase [Leptospira langatensis]TGL42436.1 ATP--guanido phosphotransferase [Leptospira langatensis]
MGEEYTKFIPNQAAEDWKPLPELISASFWEDWERISLPERLERIDSYRLPFTYRFRVARNPRNSIYPQQSKKTNRFLREFLESSSQNQEEGASPPQKKPKIPEFADRFPWNSGTLVAGDEDHIRWEYVTDSLLELNSILGSDFLQKFWAEDQFDFLEGIGFVNSCPTNSGHGDKLSVSIPANLAETGDLSGFRLPTDWGFYREELKQRLVFFRKNFGQNRKNSFFNLVSYLALLVISGKDGTKPSLPHNPF